MQLLLEKIAKNHDFGNFWWFLCFWHDLTYDVTVTSYKVCFEFFWYQWTREGHSYPLVPHTWCFIDRFPKILRGVESAPSGCEMGQNNPALLGLIRQTQVFGMICSKKRWIEQQRTWLILTIIIRGREKQDFPFSLPLYVIYLRDGTVKWVPLCGCMSVWTKMFKFWLRSDQRLWHFLKINECMFAWMKSG